MTLSVLLGVLASSALIFAVLMSSYHALWATRMRLGFIIASVAVVLTFSYLSYPAAPIWSLAVIAAIEGASLGLIFALVLRFGATRCAPGSCAKRF
jgi:hypothetical protein